MNLSLQYELLSGLSVEASYSGVHGVYWVQRINVNTVPFEWAPTARSAQVDRPFPSVLQSLGWDTATAANWSHAFNPRVERRFAKGLTLLANYTISKAIDPGGSGHSLYSQQGDTRARDAYNLKLEKAISPTDIPQKSVLSSLHQLPFVRGKRFFIGKGIVGQVNGMLCPRNGFPTDLRVTQNPPVFNAANRPDHVIGQPVLVEYPGFDQDFNPKAFAVPPRVPDSRGNPIQIFGNAGRSIPGVPGSRNLDMPLFKQVRTPERPLLQFRAEAFNLTNTPTFLLPSATSAALTVGKASFGKLGVKILW